jgi:hypothetical protein
MNLSLSSIFKKKFTFSDKKYSIMNIIGEGAFAFIYRVKSVNKEGIYLSISIYLSIYSSNISFYLHI